MLTWRCKVRFPPFARNLHFTFCYSPTAYPLRTRTSSGMCLSSRFPLILIVRSIHELGHNLYPTIVILWPFYSVYPCFVGSFGFVQVHIRFCFLPVLENIHKFSGYGCPQYCDIHSLNWYIPLSWTCHTSYGPNHLQANFWIVLC